jgi:tetratricopeptide (TPR) repeat protein
MHKLNISRTESNSKISRFRNSGFALLTVVFFLFFTMVPCFPQDLPEAEISPSLQRAEAFFEAGRYADAIRMLGQLEERVDVPDDQVKLYLLKARSYLALGDRSGCEDAVREIYSHGLSGKVKADSLEPELRVVFSTVKAEYWYSLGKSPENEDEDEKAYQQVIEQARQRPKKKSLLPKLILGAVVAGVVAGAIFLLAYGKSEGSGDASNGKLKFENGEFWQVTIEIGDVTKVVPAYKYYFNSPPNNIIYIDLPAGAYVLKVTSTSIYSGITSVYSYNININAGQETYFLFNPH